MDRREAVKYISLIMGGAMVGSAAIISGCKTESGKPQYFTDDQLALLDEIGDTIIPTTDTPGAKAAGIGAFMMIMVEDTYEDEEQIIFKNGMDQVQLVSNEKYNKGFLDLDNDQRFDLLTEIHEEMQSYYDSKQPADPPHYFRMMKELTLLGYFTSEIGVTQARRYAPVPGKFEACIDYKKGDKAWVYT